jgi:hypothetical protein
MEAGDGGLLSSVLGAGRGEDTADFADQGSGHPQTAGLVEEVAHLGAHVAESGRGAENDGIGLCEVVRFCHWNPRKCLSGCFGSAFYEHFVRHQFRDLKNFHLGSVNLTSPFGYCLGHFVDMAIHAVENNVDLGCHGSLLCHRRRVGLWFFSLQSAFSVIVANSK